MSVLNEMTAGEIMLCGIIILFLSVNFSQSEFRTGSWRTQENEYESRNNLSGGDRDYRPSNSFGGSQINFKSNDRFDEPRRGGISPGYLNQENNLGYPTKGNNVGYSNPERKENDLVHSTSYRRENSGYSNPERTESNSGYSNFERTESNSGYPNSERTESNSGYSNLNSERTESNWGYLTPERRENDLGYMNPKRTENNFGYSTQRENNSEYLNSERKESNLGYLNPKRIENNLGYSTPYRQENDLEYLNSKRTEGNSAYSTPGRRENNAGYTNPKRTENNFGYFTQRENNSGYSNFGKTESNLGYSSPERQENDFRYSNHQRQESNSTPERKENNLEYSNSGKTGGETSSGNSDSTPQETDSRNPNPKEQQTNSNPNPRRQETKTDDSNPKKQETNPGNSNPKGQQTNSGNSNPKQKETKKGDSSPKQESTPTEKCGLDVPRRIIGGTTTDIDEFPWLSLLEYSNPSGNVSYDCSGVLISKQYVLTAAHCTNGPGLRSREMKVRRIRLGEWDTSSDKDCQGKVCSAQLQDIDVEAIVPHENYKANDKSQVNDIALIRLKTEAKLSQYVQPICLPSDKIGGANYEDKKLTVSGWGRTSNAKDSSSNVKMKVELPVVNRERCRQFYQSFYGNLRIADTQFCAGGEEEKDTCQGDSGGPLMTIERTNNEIKWYVIGIVSSGPAACGVKDRPSLYTNVSMYINWIKDNIKP